MKRLKVKNFDIENGILFSDIVGTTNQMTIYVDYVGLMIKMIKVVRIIGLGEEINPYGTYFTKDVRKESNDGRKGGKDVGRMEVRKVGRDKDKLLGKTKGIII